MNKRGKVTPSNPSPNSCMQQSERESSRTRSPRGRSLSGRTSRWPCKDYLRGTCNNSICEKWHPPECLFYKTKSGCRFGEKCSFAHRQVDEQPTKRSKKNDDKSAVAILKKGDWHERRPVTDQCHDRSGKPDKRGDQKLGQNSLKRQLSDARQLGCVFQDMTPPKSILRKGTDMPKPIQRVKFTKTIARHTKIRDQNPSLGHICPGEPHERSPNAPNFEDRSQEETEWQEQSAREAAWKLAKSVLKLKEHERAAFFSPSEIGACLHQLVNLRNEYLLSTPNTDHAATEKSDQAASSAEQPVAWSVDPSTGWIRWPSFYFLVLVSHVMVVIYRMARVVSFGIFLNKTSLTGSSDSFVSDGVCKQDSAPHRTHFAHAIFSRVWLKIEPKLEVQQIMFP